MGHVTIFFFFLSFPLNSFFCVGYAKGKFVSGLNFVTLHLTFAKDDFVISIKEDFPKIKRDARVRGKNDFFFVFLTD